MTTPTPTPSPTPSPTSRSASTSADVATARPGRLPGVQRAGLVLAFVLHLVNLPSVLQPTPDGEVGPPFGVLLVCTVLAAVGLVATVLAWRGSALAKRVCAGCLVLLLVSALPAFFVDVPRWVTVGVAVASLLSVAAVALMFSGRRASSTTTTTAG